MIQNDNKHNGNKSIYELKGAVDMWFCNNQMEKRLPGKVMNVILFHLSMQLWLCLIKIKKDVIAIF